MAATVTAIDKIDGFNVANIVVCKILNGETEVATMYIPVHMALNKFGLANINAWDGSSVKTDDGYVLAPQVGAGEKDDNNAFTGLLMGKVKVAG
jgi:hypothetical protein